jgi:hypothetical protein
MATSGSKRPVSGLSCAAGQARDASNRPCEGDNLPLGDCCPLKSVRELDTIAEANELTRTLEGELISLDMALNRG